MKKQFLLLAGSALILASCGSNSNDESKNQQAQIDSIAKVNAEMQDAMNKAKNDSAINARAKFIADSMDAASKKETERKTTKGGGKKATPAPVATPPPPPPPPPPTTGNGKPKMGGQPTEGSKGAEGNTTGNGKPKMGGK